MEPILEVRDLTKQFGGLAAVKGLSFALRRGEILGLIGPNGAGKSTVMNLLGGFYGPTAGTMRFEGRDIVGWRPHRLCAAGIARTFQIVKPFGGMTVAENVRVAATLRHPDSDRARRKVQEVLGLTGMSELAGQTAGALTMERRKRLEIARALATEPKVLLLDETMAGLNAVEIDAAVELIHDLKRRGIAMIVVEHVMKVIMAISDRIVVLNHGEKIAEGSPAAVAGDPAVIHAYLGKTFAQAP